MASDSQAKAAAPRAPLALIGVFVLVVFLPSGSDMGWDENVPARITHVASEAQDEQPVPVTPSLRGCCGAPIEFHWVFLDSADTATAGSPFRTRVLALDAQGRQARPSACGELRVDMGLSGRARLSPASSVRAWRRAELRLDIESELAGVVEAEVRIESPNANADVLLHTSQIRFGSGPAHTFAIRLQSPGLAAAEHHHSAKGSSANGPWPTKSPLKVIVATQDRFGNPAMLARAGLAGSGPGRPLFGFGENFMLRANSQSVQIVPRDGRVTFDTRTGDGTASLSCDTAGVVEIWLEQIGNNATRESQRVLKERTLRRLEFVDPPAVPRGERGGASDPLSAADKKWQAEALEVRKAFKHAWKGYKKYAWGKDELQPLSKVGRDSFGGIGITILDSLTTLWLMGFSEEFEEAAQWVEKSLSFGNADSEVSVFELIIRGLGGLLGAHSLSGRPIFLTRAKELAERLLPALNTSSKLPMPKWNIALGTGSPSSEPTILAEAGSMQLELRYLTQHSGDQRFQRAGDECFEAIQRTGVTGLAPVYLTPPDHLPPRALASKFAIGALADSYYEYLLKLWLQNPSEVRFKDLWLMVLDEIPGLLRPRPAKGRQKHAKTKFKMVEVASGGDTIWKMDHLSCFSPAMIALGLKSVPESDAQEKNRYATFWPVVEGLVESCAEMWTSTKSGLGPEHANVGTTSPFDFTEVPSNGKHSFLRPETAESLFYLYRFTGDEKYRDWGQKMFRAINKHAKVEAGFASVKEVNHVPTSKVDEMQSFVMAETFKYLYLLFSPADVLDLDRYVLNTEGHPLHKFHVP